MVEGSEAGGPEQGPGSKPTSALESAAGRLRFTVELRPGETTIVSWKKLLREAKLSNSSRPDSSSGPSIEAQRNLVSQPPLPPPPAAAASSKETTGNEPNDAQAQAGPNRLSTVIERIERMYAGNGSSDEEDLVLDNVPDDDEYDTEDSFIDDAELDDYFQVDNSAIKHDGFFVNRGKLERTEPTTSTDQQPKKRRRKDLIKDGGSDDVHNPHKIMKMNKGKKATSSIQRSSTSQSPKEAITNKHMLVQDPLANTAEVSLKKTANIQATVGPSGLQNGDTSRQDLDTNQGQEVLPLNNHISERKEIELHYTPAQRSKAGKSLKAAFTQKKEGPSVRPKSTMLEKAIRELQKLVTEFRPPSTEAQDPDNAAQTVKRRLPPEIKQKLAKVARIAQGSYGKVPKDVISHLMDIVGHLMHITTLKRNLKAMANMGISAKQEKDDRLQKIKQEVAEMVNLRILHMKSKLEQHLANSDDFQEAGPQDKEALKRKYSMDAKLENKICDLYDLYVERLEEGSGPPIRRLYEELALLWPGGIMQTDGIKRAIYRAKARKGLCSRQKDQEKIKKKKVLAPISENATNTTQALHIHEKLLSDSRDQRPTLPTNPIPSGAVGSVAAGLTAPVSNRPNQAKPKQEKMKKGSSCGNPTSPKEEKMKKGSSSGNPTNIMPPNALPKKKLKRKPNTEVAETQLRLENMVVLHLDKQPKQNKNLAVPLTKLNAHSAGPSPSNRAEVLSNTSTRGDP